MSRILVVEDEERIASFIEKGLTTNGFSATVASDGDEAFALARSGQFDLMILDLGVPRKDGFDVLRDLRRYDKRMPVIILTARTSVRDTVAGLEGGADDYMPKPFRFQELLARIRLRLREDRLPEESILRVGDCALDTRTRRLLVSGDTVELTAREFGVAEMFFRHPGQVLTREQLLSEVWGYDYDPGSNVVDVYVGYLRRKLGEHRISTLRGMGYRLEERAPVSEEKQGRDTATRVLLIEDDPRAARVVVNALEGLGEVVVANEGELGVYLATAEPFEVAILSADLADSPGPRVLAQIREERPELPVIVLSAKDEPILRERYADAGASRFLARPVSVQDLREGVRRFASPVVS